jgi:DNA primase
MGTAMTERQLKMLAPALADKIILALDSDAAGQNATRRSLEVAHQTLQADYAGRLSVDIRILQIPDAKDPDDLIRETPQRWQELVEHAVPIADYVIEQDTAHLAANATLQERQTTARGLLPLLFASENNLYKNDNLQKLAIRLRISERDLWAWAQEQKINPPPIAPPSVSDAAPDFPPVDYDAVEPPPVTGEEGNRLATLRVLPAAPARPIPQQRVAAKAQIRQDAALEASCLRMLFHNPDLLFHVNRKFRELAGNQTEMLDGPLSDLGVDDFSHSTYRVLMGVLMDAFAQHDLEPLEYLEANLDRILLPELEGLLVDELERLSPRLRHGLSLDLSSYMKRSTQVVDHQNELVEKALRLRREHLNRQLEDIFFLMMDGTPVEHQSRQTLILSLRARRLLDVELNPVMTSR